MVNTLCQANTVTGNPHLPIQLLVLLLLLLMLVPQRMHAHGLKEIKELFACIELIFELYNV
jgi:hypothetical protein